MESVPNRPDGEAAGRDELSEEQRQELREIFASLNKPKEPGRTLRPENLEGVVDAYLVRRWFTLDGVRRERDEVIILKPARTWEDWEAVVFFPLIDDGYLEKITEDTHVWPCPCRRDWATRDAFIAHGCSEAPWTTGGEECEAAETGPSGTDAVIVNLWKDGRTARAIGGQLGFAPTTIYNLLGELRKKYGETIVPYRRAKDRGTRTRQIG